MLERLRVSLPLFGALSMSLAGSLACESTDKQTTPDGAGNIVLSDANNYHSTSSLTLPTIETVSGTDFEICWGGLTKDLQCHDVAPQPDVDNVALLRFLHLTEEQVEAKLTAGQLPQSAVDGYLELHTDHNSTCARLSQLSFFTTPIMVDKEYVESADQTYMFVFTKGTKPGIGARAMTFVKPSAASVNTKVEAPSGCGLLDFTADLSSLTKVAVPAAAPWVVDWRAVTKDGQGNPIVAESIDGVLLGFYEGLSVADLQAQIFEIERVATNLYELPLTGGRTADLSKAKDRATGAAFTGFQRSAPGVWMLGLMCSTCQNPAPVVMTILEPGGAG